MASVMKWLIKYNNGVKFALMFSAPVAVGFVFLQSTPTPQFSKIHMKSDDVERFSEMIRSVKEKDTRTKLEDAANAMDNFMFPNAEPSEKPGKKDSEI